MFVHDPSVRAVAAAERDLDDAELDELDGLFARVPAPFQPLGLVALDGYLCGVLVQPAPIPPEDWLPRVFDIDGRLLPDEVAAAIGHERAVALILRRWRALNRTLAEEAYFDPVVADADPGDASAEAGAEECNESGSGTSRRTSAVPAVSRPLTPWAVGFRLAIEHFRLLEEIEDEAAVVALARIHRHLPAENAPQRRLNEALAADWPLASVEDAVDDLVDAVVELADYARERRFRVEMVRREAPKVGRNDPCPCGSGRKFKRCHGAGSE